MNCRVGDNLVERKLTKVQKLEINDPWPIKSTRGDGIAKLQSFKASQNPYDSTDHMSYLSLNWTELVKSSTFAPKFLTEYRYSQDI